jgi:hypothetical protein
VILALAKPSKRIALFLRRDEKGDRAFLDYTSLIATGMGCTETIGIVALLNQGMKKNQAKIQKLCGQWFL